MNEFFKGEASSTEDNFLFRIWFYLDWFSFALKFFSASSFYSGVYILSGDEKELLFKLSG